MKQLHEFETLQSARDHVEVQGKMIHRNSMNAWLAAAGKYRRLKEIASDSSHPLGDGAAAFLDSDEYNLIQSSETGQNIIQLMQSLIAAEGNDPALQGVLDKAIAAANEVYYPYANATAHDFAKAKGSCPVKTVTPVNGYLKIILTQDVEAHRPQAYAMVQDVKTHVTTFGVVSKSGDYLAQVPRQYSELLVDNFYGAIA
ncbi:hypothetical protein [Haliea sp.]|uniref:hypothetical protein n=1 Tax=Haliea sp. TaxID=1932666 RepID=UPI0025BE266A|nr:hypothetical protein [Haliea sp.]|tara:strand:- start:126 stop:725 length:600 start_codon:yes stop_codon:yes gene_type:complete